MHVIAGLTTHNDQFVNRTLKINFREKLFLMVRNVVRIL